jgi:dipeptidyl aminopeptidase/acylaminoacyl peptidase
MRVLSIFLILFYTGFANATPAQSHSYIPRAVLFTPPEVLAIKISPDSKYLAYVKAEPSGVMNLFLYANNQNQPIKLLKQLTHFDTPEIYRFFWAGDSKNIVFLKDSSGTKSTHLYSVNIESGDLKDYSKNFQHGSAKIFGISGSKIAVGINDRNPSYHDIYLLDTQIGTLIKTFNNDRFSRFTFDENLKLIFKEEIHNDGSIDVYHDNTVYLHFSPDDAFHSKIVSVRGSTCYYLDSRNSDTTWFKSVDLLTRKEMKLAHDAKSDINDIIFADGYPVMYSTTWLKKDWHSLVSGKFTSLSNKLGSNFEVANQNNDYWIIRVDDAKRIGASFYLYNQKNEQLKPLSIAKTHPNLGEMIPFEFKTRDGLILTAYITLPPGTKSLELIKKPLPLIVFPHGGPFQARDSEGYHPDDQWLSSRGYVVLSVNFRLSSGLGKNLVCAGNHEWGQKAQFDLIDGVQWCINKGITTKSQVGIVGGSYGGYATLAALAFTPKVFAVGVSIAGPSSLIKVMKKIPNYWDFPSYPLSDSEVFFTKGAFIRSMGGNPDTPEGAQFLASRSPLNFSSNIQRPLLLVQGDHDPIINKEEPQQIFNKLKKLHKKVTLISFADEGHQFTRYANIDVSLAYIEKWLHDVLGGSFEPVNSELLKQSTIRSQVAQ